jgi:translation initiation factor IF-3
MRLIDAEGNQAGIVSLDDALNMAKEAGLDLVEISPNSDPPVCRIMDFGKYQYQQKKKYKKPKQAQTKELKYRPGTEEGDYQVKLRNLIRFLEEGDKVKITVRFRGREMAHQEFGMELLERVRDDIQDYGVVEQFPKLEGRQMIMVVASKKKT